MKKELTPLILQVCNNLRKIRESKDIKQEELALAIDVSVPTLSKIENGFDVSIGVIENICNYLKIDLSQVIPQNSNVFNFNDSPHSNGNYNNYANEKLIEILRNDIEAKNRQIDDLIGKTK